MFLHNPHRSKYKNNLFITGEATRVILMSLAIADIGSLLCNIFITLLPYWTQVRVFLNDFINFRSKCVFATFSLVWRLEDEIELARRQDLYLSCYHFHDRSGVLVKQWHKWTKDNRAEPIRSAPLLMTSFQSSIIIFQHFRLSLYACFHILYLKLFLVEVKSKFGKSYYHCRFKHCHSCAEKWQS